MATMVELVKISTKDQARIFRTSEGDFFQVNYFEDGIAWVQAYCGAEVRSFAEVVAGCFAEDSNFEIELRKAFNRDDKTSLKCIILQFNGTIILVIRETATKKDIVKKWESIRRLKDSFGIF